MPRYYCDYCDAFLTHDSPSVRKQHNSGRKHRDNVREYFGQFVTKQAQSVIDEILAKRMAGGVVGMPGMPGFPPGSRPGVMPPGMMIPGMQPGMQFNPFAMQGIKPPGHGALPPPGQMGAGAGQGFQPPPQGYNPMMPRPPPPGMPGMGAAPPPGGPPGHGHPGHGPPQWGQGQRPPGT